MTDRTCSDCAKPISRHSKGRCRVCVLHAARKDPEKEARRIAALRAVLVTPEQRAAKSAARRKMLADRKDDPVWQEYLRQSGHRMRQQFLATPGAEEKRRAAQKMCGKKISDRFLSWCPQDRRDEYQALRKKVGATEAKRVMLAEFEADEARRKAALTPLQRQIERLQAGGVLTPAFRPSRSNHDFTLGGIASGML